MERVESVKFVGFLLDEHLPWKDHIKCIENKVAKNLVYYKSSLFARYCSNIHAYLNYYGNLSRPLQTQQMQKGY